MYNYCYKDIPNLNASGLRSSFRGLFYLITAMKETWKDIEDYKGYYQISNLGRVKSLARIVINKNRFYTKKESIKKVFSRNDYLSVELSKDGINKSYYIHRLIAIHFINNPDNKPQINHIDCAPSNNSIKNLEWSTQKENLAHARKLGRLIGARGEKSHLAKLNSFQIRIIRRLSDNFSQREIASIFNVGQPNICCILNNKTWHI